MPGIWQLPPPALLESDAVFSSSVEEIYRAIYRDAFQHDLAVNHRLPVATRAARRIGEWRVLLLLTPWMMGRLLIPVTAPGLAIPPGWSPQERAATPDVVLGPLLPFTLLGTEQRAHLNYHPHLGHYLIQPLILAMEGYADADEVHAAWNEVLRTRDENMRRLERSCGFQEEVSRREFFRGLLTGR